MSKFLKTLLASLSLAAIGGGLAHAIPAVPADQNIPFASLVIEQSSNTAAKSDRLGPAPGEGKSDRLSVSDVSVARQGAVIILTTGVSSSTVIRVPLIVASAL